MEIFTEELIMFQSLYLLNEIKCRFGMNSSVVIMKMYSVFWASKAEAKML